MSEDRWQRLWRLFHEALSLAPGEREEWLSALPESDEFVVELRSLINAHHQHDSVLDTPPPGLDPPAGPRRAGKARLAARLGLADNAMNRPKSPARRGLDGWKSPRGRLRN